MLLNFSFDLKNFFKHANKKLTIPLKNSENQHETCARIKTISPVKFFIYKCR